MRLKGWLWFIGILLMLNLLLGMFGRQYRFDAILVHHSAGRTGDLSMIRTMHEKRGWEDAAYHLILSNGSTDIPEGYLEASSRFVSLSYSGATKNHEANIRDLHICVVGNYEADDVPTSLRPALAHALLALCDEFSIDPGRIVFHRDVGNTACPGKNLTKDKVSGWINDLAERCPEAVKQQHLDTIAASSLSFLNYPKALLVVQLCVSGLFAAGWFSLVMAFRTPPRGARLRAKPASIKKRKRSNRNRHR